MTRSPRRATRSIQVRVMILVVSGVLAAMLVPGWVAWRVLSNISAHVNAAASSEAASAARHVEAVLTREWNKLQEVAAVAATAERVTLGTPDATLDVLRSVYFRAEIMERTFVTDSAGRVTAQEPETRDDPGLVIPGATSVMQSGRPGVSPVDPGNQTGLVHLLVPVRDWRGTVVGVAGGSVRRSGPRIAAVLQPHAGGPHHTVEVADASGAIVTAVDGDGPGSARTHPRLLAERMRTQAPVSGTCASCHGSSQPGDSLLTIVPLRSVPWSAVLTVHHAPAQADALRLERTLMWLGPVVVGIGMLFAYGAAQSLLRPVRVLIQESQRIADGSLDQPVPDLGRDELGRLGRSFDHMRLALKASIETVEQANASLERRVEDRTRELRELSRQLADREEARARLLRQVITAQEDERKRLARELHDETCQTISALAMRLEGAAHRLPDGTIPPAIGEARTLAVRALDELHRLIYDLRPSVLDDLGLWSAIRWYAERQLESRGVSVRCEFPEGDLRLPSLYETALFRVAQEAISNIAKHAEADLVLIQGSTQGQVLTLEIEDDGKGFDAEVGRKPEPDGHGWGLLGITERVDALGGRVQIDTAPGQGVRLAVTVPLPAEAARG